MITRFLQILCLVMVLWPMTPVWADDADYPSMEDFRAWPVLHDGRVKTLESFARATLYGIAGDTSADGVTATQWLAEAIFDPAASIMRRVIKVDRVSVLDMPERSDSLYTLSEVMTAFRPHEDLILALQSRNPASISAPQKRLLDVYNALVTYNQMIQAFSAVLPIGGGERTFLDGGGTQEQRALIAAGGQENVLFRFIPAMDGNPSRPYLTVWEAIAQDVQTPVIQKLTVMAQAWTKGDQALWQDEARAVKGILYQNGMDDAWSLTLEHFYVTVNPVLLAMICYAVGLLWLVMGGFYDGRWHLSRLGAGITVLGAGVHFIALVLRILILDRPPTGTLYETFLVSSLVIMAVGLWVYLRGKGTLFLGGVAFCALFILTVSRFFVQGDSLNVLVAVLNTDFWLATHVVAITIGYAMCIVTAMTAHLYLYTNASRIRSLMIPLGLVALFFTGVGTLLGGIWADQSWGRFWGWDPKENGALLIVLWLVWILHGRLSGHLTLRGMAAAFALTNIAVAVTWFGVNLLGVGLHSYGFIEGIAWGLGLFCMAQAVIVAVLYNRHKRVYTS